MTGCATPLDRLSDFKGAESGTLVLSLGVPDASIPAQVPVLSGKLTGTQDLFELKYPSGSVKGRGLDVPFKKGAGTVIARRLPAGEYEIDEVHYSMNADTFRVSSTLPARIKFSIRTGQTSYVGSYRVYMKIAEPRRASTKGEVTTVPVAALDLVADVTDGQVRDVAIAKTNYPDLTFGAVTNFVQPE